MVELFPLSKTEFEILYDKAWENGWVYGRFFQELYDEYLLNWAYFIQYLDNLKIHNLGYVEILIGEAPPYWKGNAKNNEKSYFYNPNQIKNSSWLNAPVNWKNKGILPKIINEKDEQYKKRKLEFLASKGIVLIDIFPFPIIQDPKVRTEITGDYAYHIGNYFLKKYSEIINYIDPTEETTFSHGLVATELGALQFLCDKSIFKLKGYSYIVENPINFNKFTCLDSWTEDIIDLNPHNKKKPCDPYLILHYEKYKDYYIPIVKYSTKKNKTDWSDKLKFVRELLGDQNETIENHQIEIILDHITKLPIFMKGQNVVFDKFINGTI